MSYRIAGIDVHKKMLAVGDRESVRAESVTYVSGMNCYPCVRNGPNEVGSSGWIRTSNPPVNRAIQLGRAYKPSLFLT